MNENLVTMNQMQNEIRIMKKISIFLSSTQRKILTDLEKQLDNMIAQITMFNDRFSSYGWCTYDRINLPLVEKANAVFEERGIDAAEQILIEYYKSDVCEIIQWIVKVCWTTNGLRKCAMLTFGCAYEGNTERVSVPWRDNGEWVIMPWDLRELYE